MYCKQYYNRYNFLLSVSAKKIVKWSICGKKSKNSVSFLDPPSAKSVVLVVVTVRRYALHGLCDRNSVCPSVRPSVTLVDCVHTVQPTIVISSPYGSPIILVSGDIKFIPKFEGGHPERGR